MPSEYLPAPDEAPQGALDRLPPHADEAERGTLGCLLDSNDHVEQGDLIRKIKAHGGADLFYDARNRIVYERMEECWKAGLLEMLVLQQRLKDNSQFDQIGGADYLSEVRGSTPSVANFEHYFENVIEKAVLRQLSRISSELDDLIYSERKLPVRDIVRHTRRSLQYIDRIAPPTSDAMPDIISAADFVAQKLETPPQLIQGVLHQGLKGVIGSASKARKSWVLLDLSTSIAAGVPWWGFETTKAKVLFINFEIPPWSCQYRVQKIAEAKGLPCAPENLHIWNLRGWASKLRNLAPDILSRVERGQYQLIILDPIYKTLGGADENAAGDIAELCNDLERIAVRSGAAVLFVAHFSKGNQSGKNPMDRMSGSGVLARDPDTIITMTAHCQDDCMTVDFNLRNLPERDPIVIEWHYPLFTVREDFNPDDLKQAKGGRQPEHSEDELFKALEGNEYISEEWRDAAGMSHGTFYRLRKRLIAAKRVSKSKINSKWSVNT